MIKVLTLHNQLTAKDIQKSLKDYEFLRRIVTC
jgi:hypothetical protein